MEEKPLNPMWVTPSTPTRNKGTGCFTDAESSFTLTVYRRSENKGYVQKSFEITLHSKDLSFLQELKDFFGVGSIYQKN